MHVYLWHGNEIYVQLSSAIRQLEEAEDDIHNMLMRRYPDIPESAFLYFLAFLIFLQFIISGFTSYEMPFWSVLLCIAMAILSVLPIGVITAISGTRLGINVLTEFVIGLLLPGKTVVVMAFKSLGTNSVIQAITLLADLKWQKYNYILAVALDAGVGITVLCITMLQQNGVATSKGYLNPNIEEGVPIDYYCLGKGYDL
ncbi:hypothetical protein HK103_005229 [Boothiomyces macroporosus]|uniref:Uncharacterized protein n=1 Tax=Boothiomyces macroporosus TaxID=261099 RepID=A0AAD5UI70_9FUNG|nr:hypothetical protein HK103_005229 [Boothiomyces macroporosus]